MVIGLTCDGSRVAVSRKPEMADKCGTCNPPGMSFVDRRAGVRGPDAWINACVVVLSPQGRKTPQVPCMLDRKLTASRS